MKPWSNDELHVLRAHFPSSPLVELFAMLPRRTEDAVRRQATAQGLTRRVDLHSKCRFCGLGRTLVRSRWVCRDCQPRTIRTPSCAKSQRRGPANVALRTFLDRFQFLEPSSVGYAEHRHNGAVVFQ
jgi:hypothetical protein